MEYSERFEEQISELLRTRSSVAPEQLPGIADDEGARLLEHYARLHGTDGSVVWDGARLRAAVVPDDERPAEPSPHGSGETASSPVDQILAQPVGKSMLDSKPAGGAVPGWMWLLPLTLLLPGGIVAWWMTRETNRTIARLLLATGIVLTLVTVWALQASSGLIDAL